MLLLEHADELSASFRSLSPLQQGLEVNVGARDAAAFLADCADLRVLAVSGLGGCVEASAAALACSGATLKGGPGHAALLHLPAARGGAGPGVEVMHAQRCAPLGFPRTSIGVPKTPQVIELREPRSCMRSGAPPLVQFPQNTMPVVPLPACQLLYLAAPRHAVVRRAQKSWSGRVFAGAWRACVKGRTFCGFPQ